MFSGSGIVVVDVTADSAVGGPGGLVPGDVILGVQGRGVDNISDYRAALAAVIRQPQQGLCVQQTVIQRLEITNQRPVANQRPALLMSSNDPTTDKSPHSHEDNDQKRE